MTHALQSYSEARWQDGTGERRPLLDAGATVRDTGPAGTDAGAPGGRKR
jgi:hypothetical protein